MSLYDDAAKTFQVLAPQPGDYLDHVREK